MRRAGSWTMRTLPLSVIALFGLAGTARADLVYDFDVSASSSIDPFSFSFVVPSFVSNNQSPEFAPFEVTDGTNSWTMITDLAEIQPIPPSEGCFMFATAGYTLLHKCGVFSGLPPGVGNFFVATPGTFPTATGVYGLSGLGAFGFSGGVYQVGLSDTLDITDVPEPASIGLLAIAAAVLGWKLSNRNSAKTNRVTERRFYSPS